MSKQAGRTNKRMKSIYRRSESTFPQRDFVYIHLWGFTALRAATSALRPPPPPQSQKPRRVLKNPACSDSWAGKSEASAATPVFMFIATATVGRNLFCLDQSDTGSSSHRNRRSRDLDKEWNVPTDVRPATSSSPG